METPLIKKIVDIGESPFHFIEKVESILQGWDSTIKKTIYLFKTESGNWGYYNKKAARITDVENWKDKSALIDDHYVKMGIYHRVKLKFLSPLNYAGWDTKKRKEVPATTEEGIVIVTDTTYKQIIEQLNGRNPDSVLKFEFTTKKIGGRNSTYVNKVIWLS
jgi:hypothetical protein